MSERLSEAEITMKLIEAMEFLRDRMKRTKNNEEFMDTMSH